MEFVLAYKEGKVCEHYLPVPKDEKGELITDESNPDYWYNWCVITGEPSGILVVITGKFMG
jgi:hypothetical protein